MIIKLLKPEITKYRTVEECDILLNESFGLDPNDSFDYDIDADVDVDIMI